MKALLMMNMKPAGTALLFFLFSLTEGPAATIYSTTAGGNWNQTSTWEGGQIPGAADLVVVRSNATVSTILGSFNTCAGLTIQQGGVLLNNGMTGATLTVTGSILNEGAIRNGSAFLTLVVHQDLYFNGTEWSNYKVILQGTVIQSVSFAPGKVYTGANFFVEGTARQILGLTSLSFSGTLADFNGSTLTLAENCRLSLHGQSVTEMVLNGLSPELSMTGGAVIYNSTLAGVTLFDTIRTGSNNLYFEDQVTLASGAVLNNYGTSHTAYVNGHFINHGTVTNGSNYLTLYITGNLVQDGTWNNYYTYLSGQANQQITLTPGKFFGGAFFYNIHTAGKQVEALTGLVFRGTAVSFAYNSPGGVRGDLVLPDGGCLEVSGMGNPCLLSRINLLSAGTTARIRTIAGTYAQSFSNGCARLSVLGAFLAGNNEIFFNNETEISDTLMNYSVNGHVVYVSGTLRNLGYILNGQGTLELQVAGDLVHHGMEWSNQKTVLSGTAARTITRSPYSVFSGPYFEAVAAIQVNVSSGLVFGNTRVNGFNSVFNFLQEDSLTISGPDARLLNMTLNGNVVLDLSGAAWVQTVTCNGEVVVPGSLLIYNNSVNFNGITVLEGTMQNQNSTAHTAYFNSGFENRGVVANGTGMGNLTLELKGSVVNGGVWTNYDNRVNGMSDQHIRLSGDQPVNARFTLVSNLGGSNYQWFRNDLLIPGATGSTLVLNQVSVTEYGRYYCTSSMGQSRLITIGTLPVAMFGASSLSGCTPHTTVFVDSSTSWFPIQQRLWDFGDGDTSSQVSPSHQYLTEGSYDVSLTIDDGYFSSSVIHSSYLHPTRVPQPDFSAGNVCLGIPSQFSDLTTQVFHDTLWNIQYASEVTGFSSQYTPVNWSASQVLGPPDVYPAHADNVHAWASLTANGQREFLSLRFPQAVRAHAVIVYETLYPGTVDSVFVKDPGTMQWVPVWSGTAVPAPAVARACTLEFPRLLFVTDEIRLTFNSPAVAYWNEIDAVSLVHAGDTVVSPASEYLWEMGEGGPLLTTRGDVQYTFPSAGNHRVKLRVTNGGVCTDSTEKFVDVYPPTAAGWITGTGEIRLGDSTGSLVLVNYTGDVLLWQRKVNNQEWETLYLTQPSYAELPSDTGYYRYRAWVRSGNCNPAVSGFAVIRVLKPLMVTWSGSSGVSWYEKSNWDPGYIPDTETDVLVPDVVPNPFPVVTGSAACKDLEILPDASVTVSPGSVLTVEGSCTIHPE